MATPEETKQAAIKELARRELERRAIPASQASAAAATGGAGTGKPLRAEMVLPDTVISNVAAGSTPSPSVRPSPGILGGVDSIPKTLGALAAAPAIGVGETAAFVGGAIPSAVSMGLDYAGYPEAASTVGGYGIEGIRKGLKIPELRAAQDLENIPAIPRIAARGLEAAAGGAAFTGGLAGGARLAEDAGRTLYPFLKPLADNPRAVMKVGAIIDSAAGSAGEVMAQIMAELGQSPDTQETGRAMTQLVTSVGAPMAFNTVQRFYQGARDIVTPKPIARVEQDVGAQLAQNRLRDPNALDTAAANAEVFRQQGMEPPPIGSLTGNPALVAMQEDAMRNVPGMASREQQRQAATDAAVRSQLDAATPAGSPEDMAAGLAERQALARQQVEQIRQQFEEDLRRLSENVTRGDAAKEIFMRTVGGNLDEAVRKLTLQAEEAATAAMGRLGEGMDARTAGDLFVEELKKARTEFRSLSNDAFKEFLAGTDTLKIETDNIRIAAQAASRPTNPLTAAAEEAAVPAIIKNIREADDVLVVNPEQLQGLRSTVLSALREAEQGATANPQNARKLNIVLDAIEGEFAKLEKNIPGLDKLNAWYREGTQALKGGRVRDVGRSLRSKGGIELDPSEVAARYLRADTQTGADEAMEQFNITFGGQVGIEPQPGLPSGIAPRLPSQIASRALDEYIIGQMRLSATDPVTGQISASKLADFVGRHKIALARRPELASKLKDTAKAQLLADDELKRIAALKASYERDVMKSAADPSDEVLKQQIRSKEKELRAFAKSAESDLARKARVFELAIEFPQDRLNDIINGKPGTAKLAIRRLEKELDGNQDAIDGMKAGLWRAVINNITDPLTGAAAPSPLVNPRSFALLMDKHGDLVRELFGSEREDLLKTMQTIAKQNTTAGTRTAVVGEAERGGRVQAVMSQIISRAYGVARGVVGVPYIVGEGLARLVFGNKSGELNQAQAQKLLEAALYDVDVYKRLVRAAKFPRNQRNLQLLARRLGYVREGTEMALDNRKLRTRQDLRAKYEREGYKAQEGTAY